MSIPTSIPETPIAQPDQSPFRNPMRIQSVPTQYKFHHILITVFKIDEDEEVSFPILMEYRRCNNITDQCRDFHFELNHINDLSDYRVDRPKCALQFCTMNKLRGLISWMLTRMKDTTFELYAEHLLALTYEEFNEVRQEVMNRMHSTLSNHTHDHIYWLYKRKCKF